MSSRCLLIALAFTAGCAVQRAETPVAAPAPKPVPTAGAVPAPAPLPPPTDLPVVTTEPVIDGALDDACWQAAPAIPVVYGMDRMGERSADTPMTVRYAWDSQYLYIGYETSDKNIVAIGSGVVQAGRPGAQIWGPEKKVDICEFFISTFDDPMFFWELHHNAANQFDDVWCAVIPQGHPESDNNRFRFGINFNYGENLEDDGAAKVAMAVKLKPKADGTPSTINDPSDEDTGYSAEIRIPWGALGAPMSQRKGDTPVWNVAGREIRILAVLQDGDRAQRYLQSSPTFRYDWFHHGWKAWNRFKLAK